MDLILKPKFLQIEQYKREKEEVHDPESNTLNPDASKNKIVLFKDTKNDDYHLLRDEDKVSNCFLPADLALQT